MDKLISIKIQVYHFIFGVDFCSDFRPEKNVNMGMNGLIFTWCLFTYIIIEIEPYIV